MHAADQVVSFNETVRHQRPAVQAAAVEDRDLVIEAHDNEIDFADQGILRRAVFEVLQLCDSNFVHFISSDFSK